MRLDNWLAQQGKVSSRTKAKSLIASGFVYVNGQVVEKSSYAVRFGDIITIDESSPLLRYVSRGGLKLEEALHRFNLDFTDARVLDIGSSTGGFTHCALQHGAACVFSVDVGTDCMDKALASDKRVHLYEQTDIRNAPDECFHAIDYVVCDASFVSLLVIAPVFSRIQNPFRAMLLIKPQFECGKDIAKRCKGVLADKQLHTDIVKRTVQGLCDQGLRLVDIAPSPIRGGDGNREYITLFEPSTEALNDSEKQADADEAIHRAVERAFCL